MNKFALAAILGFFNSHCQALEGHNGINFKMTQQQLEKLEFICRPSTDHDSVASCRHMEMTGVAFGIAARNYKVIIGRDKRVASIEADLIGIRTASEYLALLTRISDTFPSKDEAESFRENGVARDRWRSSNNAGIQIYASDGGAMIGNRVSVTFFSPSQMALFDKKTRQQ